MSMQTYTIKDMHSKKESEIRAANIDNLRSRLMRENEPRSGKPVDLMVSIGKRSLGIFHARYNARHAPEFAWRKANGDVTPIRPNGTIPPTR